MNFLTYYTDSDKERDTDRQTETGRQAGRQADKQTDRLAERERERDSNSKPLILKDNSISSGWICLAYFRGRQKDTQRGRQRQRSV